MRDLAHVRVANWQPGADSRVSDRALVADDRRLRLRAGASLGHPVGMRPAVLAVLVGVLCATVAPAAGQVTPRPHSVAVGKPWHGRLLHGVQLPAAGADFVTWDPVLELSPDRGDRRWGTEELVVLLEDVAREYRAAHPQAPPVLIADLSRPHGGPFGKRFGGLGHASHQNGLDADVVYPRADRALSAPRRPSEIDRALAQDLVDRFVRAGAVKVFVGPHVRLRGPRRIVRRLAFHDDHMHVRIANPR
jgi:murein endopeptidase